MYGCKIKRVDKSICFKVSNPFGNSRGYADIIEAEQLLCVLTDLVNTIKAEIKEEIKEKRNNSNAKSNDTF